MSDDASPPLFVRGARVVASIADVAAVSGVVLSWGATPAPYLVIQTYNTEEVVFLGPGVIVKRDRSDVDQ